MPSDNGDAYIWRWFTGILQGYGECVFQAAVAENRSLCVVEGRVPVRYISQIVASQRVPGSVEFGFVAHPHPDFLVANAVSFFLTTSVISFAPASPQVSDKVMSDVYDLKKVCGISPGDAQKILKNGPRLKLT